MPASNTLIAALLLLAAATTGSAATDAAAVGQKQTILDQATAPKSAYPKIVIYTVSWCPHCRELKEYLTARNIPFINKDVELDAVAMEELTGKYKSKGVPIVVFGADHEILRGFTPQGFEQAAAKALAKEKK